MRIQSTFTIYILILIALLGYIIPWVIAPTTPLTLGAYDLAEWASLHPSQPHTSPSLLVPLLLRVQLLIITILIAIASANDRKHRFIAYSAVIMLSIAQLPPLEFLISESGNINYQQQMTLAITSLVVGIGLTAFKLPKLQDYIIVLVVLLGIGTAAGGLEQAQQLYDLSLQEYTVGFGVWILLIAYVLIYLQVVLFSPK